MRVQSPILPSSSASMEMVVGKDKGKSFELISDRLSIGRSENNDIVLASESVSRYHAALERKEGGKFYLKDNQSKNGIVLNGKQVTEAELRDGDVVQIGIFVFRFHGDFASPAPEPKVFQDEPGEGSQYPQALPGLTSKRGAGPRNNRPIIYTVLAIVLGAALYISQQEDKSKEASPDTATGEEAKSPAMPGNTKAAIAPKLDLAPSGSKVAGLEDPALSGAEQKIDKVEMGNSAIREAEQYFRKGQREYSNKNYSRAIQDFRSALSLYRNHELADYYLRLAIYEVENQAKKNYEYGRKYFESMQYGRAIYHFNEVILLMEHRPTDQIVADSEKFIVIAKKRLQAAEQFP